LKVSLASFASDDGKRRVEIFDHQDGFFSYEESCETTDLVPEYGPDTYWMTSNISGLYESAETAECDARTTVPWLRAI
jgi:hypothetical protein